MNEVDRGIMCHQPNDQNFDQSQGGSSSSDEIKQIDN